MARRLPPHLLGDLFKVIVMEVFAAYVLYNALKKLWRIDLLDMSSMYGRAFAVGIVALTFIGLYTALSSAEKIHEIGSKVVYGEEA